MESMCVVLSDSATMSAPTTPPTANAMTGAHDERRDTLMTLTVSRPRSRAVPVSLAHTAPATRWRGGRGGEQVLGRRDD